MELRKDHMTHASTRPVALRMIVGAAAVLAALLAFVPAASAARDPISGGTTDLHLKKGFLKKLTNLGVGLDTANLILYGKANPVDAVSILGPHVHAVHAKDGRWPTDPDKLGEEVLIGTGLVDFHKVFAGLRKAGYSGAITIERETHGPKQIEDVRQEKQYLEKVLAQIT